MSIFGPFTSRIGILQRSPHLVDLLVRNSPDVLAYRLWLSRNVNNAYGTIANSGLSGTGGLAVLEAQAKKSAMSKSVARRGVGMIAEVFRDQTRFQFDVDDFIVPAAGPVIPEVPSDDEFIYARVQEKRTTMGWLAVPGAAANNATEPYKGPILVIPPASFFGAAASIVALGGLAPAGSDCAVGDVPVYDPSMQKPPPMHLVMPRPLGSVTIYNRDDANTLLVTFGKGMPMIKVPPGKSVQPTGGGFALPGVTEFILAMAGAGVGCQFAIEGVVGHQA